MAGVGSPRKGKYLGRGVGMKGVWYWAGSPSSSLESSSSVWSDIWNSELARNIIPDVLTVDITAGASLVIGNSGTATLNLLTRGEDAGFHLTKTLNQANLKGHYRYGLDVDAGINVGYLNFYGDPRKMTIDHLLGTSGTLSAGLLIGFNINRGFGPNGELYFNGASAGIGVTAGLSYGRGKTSKLKF